ncbi:reverse transcriptase domain-containing protein [Artemisia annua]|uniref:Reverse transcriptase domain-containing protein n=1 Tax=Artemisia annua TaxID=35608 RepID=A0A2U1Q3E9_ARTAN|nr:reverse transcriptase domain-containing protein [Artemisia annua]
MTLAIPVGWHRSNLSIGVSQTIVSDKGQQLSGGNKSIFSKGDKKKQKQWNELVEEVVIPAEMVIPTKRVAMVDQEANEKVLRLNLELVVEKRDRVAIKIAHSKQKMAMYYNKKVHPVRDHVLKKNEASKATCSGKMSPTWEGSYTVRTTNPSGFYLVMDKNEYDIPLAYDTSNLKRCYI